MLVNQNDIKVLEVKDYIKSPKQSGYKSYHMIVGIPVYMSNRCELVKVEVQIRTVAAGTGLTYCWQFQKPSTTTWKNSGLSSASSSTLSFKMSSGYDGMKFRCKVTDAGGSVVYTDAALVKRAAGPVIVEQPEDVTKALGTKATFSIEAEGNGLTYQWQYQKAGKTTWVNSTSTGNKTDTLKVSATTGTNGMKFRCVVTNQDEIATVSEYAVLIAEF